MKKRLGDFLRSAVTESLPVAARVSTETLVLSFGGPPVVASGAGEVAERMADAVIRSFHPANVALEPGPAVVVAPIPEDSRVSPGFFLYTLKTVPDGDGWRVLPHEIDRVYPHYVADGRLAQWIGQRLAGKDGTFDVLDAVRPGTAAQIAWSLWIDQRARTTFSDDWYYRETMYYIGSVESASGTGYYLWNRGVTNHGFTYAVWTGTAMSEQEPPRIFETRQALEEALHDQGDIPIAPTIWVPEDLRMQLTVVASPTDRVPHVSRSAPSPPMVHVSRSQTVRTWQSNGSTVPDLHASFYVAGFQSTAHPDPVYVVWRPVPDGPVNAQGLPHEVQLVTNGRGDVLVWRSADSAFAYMARQGFFAQRHPRATPVGVIEPAIQPASASAIPVRLV